jgi:carboxypeptidase family protein
VVSAANLRVLSCFLLLCTALSSALTGEWQQDRLPPTGPLQITVTDQNGAAVPSAVVLVQQHEGKTVASGSTSASGRVTLGPLIRGTYKLIIQKQGFYSASTEVAFTAGPPPPVEVRLQPVREYSEEVEVSAHPSVIDPQQTATIHSIDAADISSIPYFHTRDYRNVLPYIPGVLSDSTGQIHVIGAATQQTQDYFDGFEMSQPAGGTLALRVNPDALRKIDIQSSRYSAQFGKGSGGLLNLEAQDGDNHYRFNATDFIPTLQTTKGLDINNWTPRAYFSGPIIKDRLWFDLAHQSENDLNLVKQLPSGADSNHIWQTADMLRLRLNVSPGNVLTANGLVNLSDFDNSGISPFDPAPTTTNQDAQIYLITLKDQITIAKDTLLEIGAATHITDTTLRPQGTLPYVFAPGGRTGNFFEFSQGRSERTQGIANLYGKPMQWMGTHQFTVGGNVDRVVFHNSTLRHSILFTDQNGALLRQSSFQNVPAVSLNTLESGAFVQDRWSAGPLLLEPGVRWDRDDLINRNVVSPRLAGTYMLNRNSETKLSAGAGIYYDRTNLEMVSRAFEGSRTDTFFSPVPAVLPSIFLADPATLRLPRFVNASAGIESRLPSHIYGRLEFISRHGTHGWAYEQQPNGSFVLGTNREDRYDAVQITLRKELKPGYPILLAYTRSKARSNETLDFSLDNPVFGNQVSGPLPWDAPNQVVSWGWLPLPSVWIFKRLDFAYSALWHTGFPFITVDQFGRLVAGPAGHRFPDLVNLSPAVEYKFGFHGYRWALRVGIDNITNSSNPEVVDNNINSPTFGQFFGTSHRSFNGRIRLLGKK